MTTTGFTKNFVVKNGLTTGAITLDGLTGNISGTNESLTGNLSVTGKSNLGNIGNVNITGGASGYIISTDGSGNLNFISPSATQSPAPMPTYVASGDTLTISANYQGLFGYPITVDGTLTVDGILIDVNDNGSGGGGGNSTPGGLNTQLQYNNASALGGIPTATYEFGILSLGSNADIKISGGSLGQYLQTDGAGNLSWAAGGGGGGGSPGGITTQVQFNDSGSFAGNTGFTFNKTSGTLTATIFSGFGNALANLQGSNVVGAVGLSTYATTANSVAGANVSGAVAYATTANAVAGANVTGQVNYAAVANSVAGANVTGTVSLATYATTANSVAGANVSGAVAYATTANSVAGANVTGTVANATYATTTGSASTATSATTAGTVTTAAQPNITSVGTLSSISVSGNANVGNIGAASGVFTANISANNLTTTNKVTAGNGLLVSTGALTVSNGNLDVTGNINVTGNLNYSNVTDLVVGDPLIYIGANNTGDLYDLGIVGSYNNGTYYHTGIARNATTDTWTFFDGVVAEPTTVIDWANATYPPVKMGNLIASNANLGNAATANYFIGNFYGTANLATYATTANAVAGANVSGAVAYATTANSVAGANVSGQVGNALVAGTVYTNAQPNITSVGTLASVTVSGTSNLGAVGNITITGGTSGQMLSTDGSGTLSWATPSTITTSIVSGTTQAAVKNYRYVLANASATTLTLPSSPTLGDTVYLVVANDLLTNIVARNGQKIMSLDQDMTINSSNAAFGLLYTNSTLGWRVI